MCLTGGSQAQGSSRAGPFSSSAAPSPKPVPEGIVMQPTSLGTSDVCLLLKCLLSELIPFQQWGTKPVPKGIVMQPTSLNTMSDVCLFWNAFRMNQFVSGDKAQSPPLKEVLHPGLCNYAVFWLFWPSRRSVPYLHRTRRCWFGLFEKYGPNCTRTVPPYSTNLTVIWPIS